MGFITLFILGILILPAIIYYTVRDAVRTGTYNALVDFEQYKNEKQHD